MLLNGILYSSEAWHCLTEANIKILQEADEYLIRKIFNAHSKTSIKFLHLETGTLPLRFVIASRRLNYLKNILDRSKNELVLNILEAQKEDPTSIVRKYS